MQLVNINNTVQINLDVVVVVVVVVVVEYSWTDWKRVAELSIAIIQAVPRLAQNMLTLLSFG